MTKWEYIVFTGDDTKVREVNRKAAKRYEAFLENEITLSEFLNVLGQEGWELVSHQEDENSFFTCILKRPQ